MGVEVSEKEITSFIAIARKLMWRPEYRDRLEDAGISLTPARFYNEIPTVKELEQGFENTEPLPYDLPFLSVEMIRRTLKEMSKFNSEFTPPKQAETGFYWDNPAFSFTDAMAYYCLIRAIRPGQVIEIGSGFSTLVAKEAAAKNGRTTITCIEPYPKPFLNDLGFTIHRNMVQTYDAEFFNDTLSDGDILFIDSTHTVKASSDCCHLYLRVLPHIRKKVFVHVHDIFLPKTLNIKAAIEKHIYWTEQHLLAAYLLDNPKVRFLFGSNFASISAKAEVAAFMQGKWKPGGGSFWFELDGVLG